MGNLSFLKKLELGNNHLVGQIPPELGRLVRLQVLNFSRNYLQGSIPVALAESTNLTTLVLSHNQLQGEIPMNLNALKNLDMLDFQDNGLSGQIPQSLADLPAVKFMYLSRNRLLGDIPHGLGNHSNLLALTLDNNMLSGVIPSSLGKLKGLEALYLSRNNFSGQIPKSLGDLSAVHYLDLSFNLFSGEGNRNLCGGIPDLHLPPCSSLLPKKIHKFPLVPVLTCLIAAPFVLVLLYRLLTWHKKVKAKSNSTMSKQGHLMVSYAQLVKATDGFSANNFVGSGSFGSVYKERTTNLVAVKVLKLLTPKAHESFMSECEALRTVRHRNLIKIITVCASTDNRGNDFKAIVYDFMSNGSLESWLHPDTGDQVEHKYLNLHQRVAILLDVAYALDYLHCHGPAPIAHCDVKSSNVLLDSNMVAHVGDFGLARILVDDGSFYKHSTSSMVLRGTIGYAAPEYGAGNMVSTNGDIYSYGILILETVSGKRPTDGGLRQGFSLREYVEQGLLDKVTDIADMQLSSDLENELRSGNDSSYKRRVDCLVSLFRLGISCSQELPSSRTPTRDIIKELHTIKESLNGIM
ncbi:hypothetical protein HU200_013576 [Digitaria exilis]|uniref:Receptor kinase-like protein Xa21 n=1 Tax=Digitaria exilis TaxID=1010633 RepID=A0A835KNP7_9POAL|nr:hypothetical protein HU200_013576 [Digitaria exilis]